MIIYHFENVSYAYKGWDAVFRDLAAYLKDTYNAEVKYKGNYPAEEGTYFYVNEFDYKMADCELIIYDEENDILKAISFSEARTRLWDVFVKRNNEKDLLLVTQFCDWFNKDTETGKDTIDLSQFNFTVGSTTFYTLNEEINYQDLYKRRKEKSFDQLEDKMFMLFTTERIDPFELSKQGYLNQDMKPLGINEYFDKLINYKIGLAVGTLAEYCYREIEYMAIGVPFIRIEYMRELNPKLIPNYHYIAINRDQYNLPYNNSLDRLGGEKYIKAYIDRFLEVKDDEAFLSSIANNARDYYLNYCSPQNRIKHLLGLLNIN